jgi:hypothetical protein
MEGNGMEVRTMKALLRAVVALTALGWLLAFALPSGAATPTNDGCGFASSSFTESTVMRWAQINGQGTSATLAAYGNDEKGLLLGVDGATPLSSATSNGTNSFHSGPYAQPGPSDPQGGSKTATDASGRVFFPALYITNLTAHPLSGGTGVGDFQNGGTVRNISGSGQPFIDDAFGAWSTATTSGGYQVTQPAQHNDWTLGSGSDAPVGTTFSAMGTEGYGTEVRWNVNQLTDSSGQALQPGNTYRFQIIEHDGDQNKSGGDSGEFCVNLKIPGVPAISLVKAERIGSSGSFTHGPVTGNPGDTVNYQMTVTNTGDTSLTLNFTDPKCDAGTLSGPSPALTNNTLPKGASVQYTCSHVLSAGDSPKFTNTANVVGTAPDGTQVNATDSVDANVALTPAITLHKVERIGSSGSFTHGPVTGSVGDRVNYQMRVTNTGNTTLVIAFTDDQCDSGTLSGPTVLSGTYDAATKTLSASGGELLYTCSHVLAAGDQPYTNTASVTGTPPSGSPVSAQDSVRAFANTPGLKVVKLQRDGTSGAFTTNQINARVGDTIYYKVEVTDTGNVPLTLSLDDAHCDAGTIQGPASISGTLNGDTLSAGGVAQYTCSHVVTAEDIPQYTNTAIVTGTPPSGPPIHGTGIVVANITQAAIQVLKLERDASSGGGFTTGPITVTEESGNYVVHTIDYEIQVTNTGSAPLTLSLDDPLCDAGTIQGPAVITGTLNGKVLSPGGQAQYTCSHRYVQGDPTPFTNVATVTGTPPSGPPVSGTSRVTVKRTTLLPKHVCRTPSGRVIHYTGHKKPAACRPSKPPHKHHGFTG